MPLSLLLSQLVWHMAVFPTALFALTSVSWRYMSRLYLLVPVVTLLFFAGLVALITWGWYVTFQRPS